MKKLLILTSICMLPIFSYADSTTNIPAGSDATSPKYINDYIPYSDSRTYIDLNLGTMNAPFPTYDPQYPGQSPFNLNSQSSMTFNINAGYYFNPYFGVEGGLTHASISYSPNKGYDGSNYNSIAVGSSAFMVGAKLCINFQPLQV